MSIARSGDAATATTRYRWLPANRLKRRQRPGAVTVSIASAIMRAWHTVSLDGTGSPEGHAITATSHHCHRTSRREDATMAAIYAGSGFTGNTRAHASEELRRRLGGEQRLDLAIERRVVQRSRFGPSMTIIPSSVCARETAATSPSPQGHRAASRLPGCRAPECRRGRSTMPQLLGQRVDRPPQTARRARARPTCSMSSPASRWLDSPAPVTIAGDSSAGGRCAIRMSSARARRGTSHGRAAAGSFDTPWRMPPAPRPRRPRAAGAR